MQQSIFGNTQHSWVLSIDGASRGNPGKSGAGIFIQKDGEVVVREGFYLGVRTNNQAEYYALLLGLFLLKQFASRNDVIRIISDSELLVKQMKGQYKVKHDGLLSLYGLARVWFNELNPAIMHVLRADNKDADALANKGIDEKKVIPETFRSLLVAHGITF